MTEIDGSAFKAGQKEQWDSVAEAWRKWWPSIERDAGSVSEALAKIIEVKPGHRILDVSTGIGEPAVTLARLVGPQGSVLATDQSTTMLTVAQERIADEELNNIELLEADTEALNLLTNEFDGAVCRWGLMFLPDVQAGLQKIRMSLKPGAKFAATVWSTPDRVPFASLPMAVAHEVLNPPPAPPPANAPGIFSLGAPGELEATLQTAGFRDVTPVHQELVFELDSPEQYCEWLSDLTPPIRAMLVDRPPEQIEDFWSAVKERATAFVNEDGTFAIPNFAPTAVGKK